MEISLLCITPNMLAYGLRCISASLKAAGHKVNLVFLPRAFFYSYEEDTLQSLLRVVEHSGLIGISVMTNFFDNAVAITERIKKDLDVPVVWGGIHPTVRPDECLRHADMVCIGEGEEALVELAARMGAGERPTDIPGLWVNGAGGPVKNPLRELITDLDGQPKPDYDLQSHYVLRGGKTTLGMTYTELDLHPYPRGTYPAFLSRGCPYACSYCINNALTKLFPHNRSLRRKSVEYMIAECVSVKERFPEIETITFDDDAFFALPLDVVTDFAKQYRERVGLPFTALGVEPNTVSRDKLEALIAAGLCQVRMGIQTGSDRTRKLYRRSNTNERILAAAEVISSYKADLGHVFYDIILDNPYEREEDVIETIRLLNGLPRPFELFMYALVFFPGTELYERARADGIIKNDLEEVYRKHLGTVSKTPLNKLIMLIDRLGRRGLRVPEPVVSLLTAPSVKKYGLRPLLFLPITAYLAVISVAESIPEAVRAVKQRDFRRFGLYIARRTRGLLAAR